MGEKKGTVFTVCLEKIGTVKNEEKILSQPFLEACKQILPVIDKFGAAMAIVKSDINGNIGRLENKYASDESKYEYLYEMVVDEVKARTAKKPLSCTNGLLWLTRAMDFLVALLMSLLDQPELAMSEACTASYRATLRPFHGIFASGAFTVAMSMAPARAKFMQLIGGDAVLDDMRCFCDRFSPLLKENHRFLAKEGMDSMKA